MRAELLVSLAACVRLANAHGFLTVPAARQPGASTLNVSGTNCKDNSCGWYSNGVKIAGRPTICDRHLLTSSMAQDGHGIPCSLIRGRDYESDKPWRAPGTAPILSPCGKQNANKGSGQDGRNLPPGERVVWQKGDTANVAMSVTANHGGGYSYRLCPASSPLTEACFQSGALKFATNTTTVRFTDGSEKSIPATRTSQGTHPTNSQWTKNPIPKNADYFPPPFEGAVDSHWPFSLVDEVVVPSTVAPGNYVLSWRWDCELTPQVWTNCGDISIVGEQGSEVKRAVE